MNACDRNRQLVLDMVRKDCLLTDIAKKVGTNRTRVKEFLKRNGIHKEFSKSCCGSGPNNGHWKGGRVVGKSGYVYIWMPDHPHSTRIGYVLEHRLVMEKHIGRILKKSEVVHHKNKIHDDNRIENLELFSRNSEHLAHELKGKIPQWTPDGIRRMRRGIVRSSVVRKERIQSRSKLNAPLSR